MAPTVSDPSLQNALDNSTSQMVVAVETLRACLARASPIARQLQMDGALARLLRIVREAEELENSAKAGTLTALPDDRVSPLAFLVVVTEFTQEGSTLHCIIISFPQLY